MFNEEIPEEQPTLKGMPGKRHFLFSTNLDIPVLLTIQVLKLMRSMVNRELFGTLCRRSQRPAGEYE
jgi:hypothetical protein